MPNGRPSSSTARPVRAAAAAWARGSSGTSWSAPGEAWVTLPDYFEALTYKNLLLRSEALLEKDPAKQQQLIKQADQLRDKAQELQKQKQAAAAAPSKP